MSRILTIVVTYNGLSWIDRCIQSLLASKLQTDIIVIDNGSQDGIDSYITLNYPRVQFVKNPINIGFGSANNIGLLYAINNNYDYVFLLNQDAYVYHDTLHQLLKSSETYINECVISPLHLNYEGTEIESGCLQFIREGIEDTWFNIAYFKDYPKSYKINFINAAAWFIPIEIIKNVGGFDPIFFQYGEDNDWVNRLKYRKFGLILDMGSRICHKSNFRTWSAIEHDSRRVLTTYLVELKNPFASLISNYFLLFKRELDKSITYLLIGKFKDSFFSLGILWRLLSKIPMIKRSRRIMNIKQAYLN